MHVKDDFNPFKHHKVIEAIMSIFKTQGLKCVTFLPQVSCVQCMLRFISYISSFVRTKIIPAFASVARTASSRERERERERERSHERQRERAREREREQERQRERARAAEQAQAAAQAVPGSAPLTE